MPLFPAQQNRSEELFSVSEIQACIIFEGSWNIHSKYLSLHQNTWSNWNTTLFFLVHPSTTWISFGADKNMSSSLEPSRFQKHLKGLISWRWNMPTAHQDCFCIVKKNRNERIAEQMCKRYVAKQYQEGFFFSPVSTLKSLASNWWNFCSGLKPKISGFWIAKLPTASTDRAGIRN